VTAFGKPVTTNFFNVNAVDLSAQVTALTAQVAALTADYNALAAKWNKRVASKTAPKKAVTLK
jgi:outer membrane murein-binding lipoprotein Lpp